MGRRRKVESGESRVESGEVETSPQPSPTGEGVIQQAPVITLTVAKNGREVIAVVSRYGMPVTGDVQWWPHGPWKPAVEGIAGLDFRKMEPSGLAASSRKRRELLVVTGRVLVDKEYRYSESFEFSILNVK